MSSDGLRASGEQASAVAAGKNKEEFKMDIRWDIAEVGVLLEGGGESHPGGKQMISVGSSRNHDAVAGRFRCSKEIRAESVSVGSQYKCQGATCGK